MNLSLICIKRHKLGLSQRQLAEKINRLNGYRKVMSQTHISSLELHRAKPSLKALKNISIALEIPIIDLIKEYL